MNKRSEYLTELLLKGNEEQAWELVLDEHEQLNGCLMLFQELISPAMVRIGDLWETDAITVADEHLATMTCDYVLSRYQHMLKKEKKDHVYDEQPRALFLCIEDEQHYLGLKMISIIFEDYGWNTKFLGANLPLEYAMLASEKWEPEVIGLSFSMAHYAPRLSEYIEKMEAQTHQPQVMIGGRMIAQYPHNYEHCCSKDTKLISTLGHLSDWLASYEEGAKSIVKH